MTKQKHLKTRIRARMAKTGESYSSARRHLVGDHPQAPARSGYQLRSGIHPDTAALANALANHGVTAAPTHRPLSEAMVLGIGGGLGAGYILWQFKGHHPIVTLGFRNRWQYPDRWLQRSCEQLGIHVSLEHTSGPVKAMSFLEETLAGDGPRPLVWIDAQEMRYWQLPEHLSGHGGYPLVVYGREDGRFLIDDRNSAPLTVAEDTLRSARGRVSSYRNRLARLEPPKRISSDRLIAAVSAGLEEQVQHLSSHSDSFSLPAWRKWSRMLTDEGNKKSWTLAFENQIGLFGVLLSLYEGVESSGYNGGSLRDLYAQFLDEAAELLAKPALGRVAESYRELDLRWTRLVETAAPRDREPFAAARQLIDSLHEHVLEEGDGGSAGAREAGRELWALRSRLQEESVFDSEEFADLLQQLSDQLDAIYVKETEAVAQLTAAMRD